MYTNSNMYSEYYDDYPTEGFGIKNITGAIKDTATTVGSGVVSGATTVGSGVVAGAKGAGNLGKDVLGKVEEGLGKAWVAVLGVLGKLGKLKWLILAVLVCCCSSFMAPALMPAFMMAWRLT